MKVNPPEFGFIRCQARDLQINQKVGWGFTETSNSRLALGLRYTILRTTQAYRVMICEEDGNYAGASYTGLFEDEYSVAFFISALLSRYKNLEGKVEEVSVFV